LSPADHDNVMSNLPRKQQTLLHAYFTVDRTKNERMCCYLVRRISGVCVKRMSVYIVFDIRSRVAQ
jgi:hypothetical protein